MTLEYTTMHVYNKYNILKRVVVNDQNLLNTQRITHWSKIGAILMLQGLYNNSVILQQY